MSRQEIIESGELGTVYILHLDSKLNNHANHYIGWARQLENRLHHHRKGTGAKFTKAANLANIQYSIAADWPGTKNLERAMKNNRNHKEWCPICMGDKARNPLTVKWRESKLTETPLESIISPEVYNNTTDEEKMPEMSQEDVQAWMGSYQ